LGEKTFFFKNNHQTHKRRILLLSHLYIQFRAIVGNISAFN
jgi:hypothetical protein